MVAQAVEVFGALDVPGVASGMKRVTKIDAMAPADFAVIIDANVTHSWLLARATTGQMKA